MKLMFRSREDGNPSKYQTSKHRDGVYTCTCPGWMFQAGKTIHQHKKSDTSELCWHVKRLKEVSICKETGKPVPELDPEDYKTR